MKLLIQKIILTLSLLAPIFVHAMDRREIVQEVEKSCCSQLQQAAQQAGKAAQQAATVCCMTAPFWTTAGIISGGVTYAAFSCVHAPHRNNNDLIQVTLLVSAASVATSAALITQWSIENRNKKLKKE